jgi:protein SCO1/2
MSADRRLGRPVRVLLFCALVVSACAGPDDVRQAGVTGATSTGTPLPNVVFQSDDGRSMRFYDDLVKGRVVLINFMFTTCRRACPGTTANLKKVRRALGDHVGNDVVMLSISLDPEHDTPEVLHEYARLYGVGPGWYFLSGRREDVERLRRTLGAYDLNPEIDADRTRHAGLVVLGNEPMGRWSAVSGLARPRQIVEAVERVMKAPEDWNPATWSGGRAPPTSTECSSGTPSTSLRLASDGG